MKIMRMLAAIASAVVLLVSLNIMAKSMPISDEQIKEKIIQASVSAYPGNCPCPYHSARNGRQCGKRSAWSRVGKAGIAPFAISMR